MKEIIYAGIGARSTPPDVLEKMRKAAKAMAGMGFVLRSGGARGADTAFYEGVCEKTDPAGHAEIFLPYDGFNGHRYDGTVFIGPPNKEARLLASKFHPNWPVLGCRGRDFMARNAYQVLGYDLDRPCDFILCWTPNGKVVGGTGQALRMAKEYDIPVINFGNSSDDDISDFIFAQATGK